MSKKFGLFLAFVLLLCLGRPFVMQGSFPYLFIIWNLILAAIPFIVVECTKNREIRPVFTGLRLGVWLLFFPNAPYIVTDLVHLDHSTGFDWYDTILILSAALAGLKFAFDSLELIVSDLRSKLGLIPVWIWKFAFLAMASYGVYLGRFLRFNSWDILGQPIPLLSSSLQPLLHPFLFKEEWVMISLFALFLGFLDLIWPKEKALLD